MEVKGMGKKEEKIEELENKIEGLSKQVGGTQELIMTLTKYLTDFSGFMAQWIEERRKEAEKKVEKRGLSLYYRGLAMGLILGVIGNLFVSYLMKVLEIFNIPALGWVIVAIGALGATLILIWDFDRESKKLLKELE
jgi:uncharacterized membrane protein YeaQ/YmgE (transglycosylase-associated protein family)